MATAFVAFDLDGTLGSFDPVGPWSSLFSIETLENEVNKASLSAALKQRLRVAERAFIQKIKADTKIMNLIFRPNLDALIRPLIKAKRAGKIGAVCMYSNTFETFTMYFAKRMIEEQYAYPGFFDCLVDSTHPIRKYDWDQNKEDKTQPLKTFHGLKKIFKMLCGVKETIRPENILFVDDRQVKHHLETEEKNGLTYLQVSSYIPDFTMEMRKRAYIMGLEVLLETNLVDCPAFLSSKIFHTEKPMMVDNEYITVKTDGVFDLLKIVENDMLTPYQPPKPFENDTVNIRRTIIAFLKKN
jgi:hypothetical protein